MDEIYIYTVPLPQGINEAIMPCFGGYTIYLNETLDHPHLIRALNHALKHIKENDWERSDVQSIETKAHRKE